MSINHMKRSITLLEVLIVVVLLGVVAGLFSFRFYGKREQFFFSKNFSKLEEKIMLTRKMALFNQKDFFIKFKEDQGKLLCQIYSNSPEKQSFQKNNKVFSPLNFRWISDDQQQSQQLQPLQEISEIELMCTPQGVFYPSVVLEISANKDFSNARKIVLNPSSLNSLSND